LCRRAAMVDWIAKLHMPDDPGYKQRVVQKTGRKRKVFLPPRAWSMTMRAASQRDRGQTRRK
jgi:hypothetical protein